MRAPTEVVIKECNTVKGMHVRLKEIVGNELDRLPELLEQLEAKERVKAIMGLLPYVATKMEAVAAEFSEPFQL